jgi:hypothetical protein
MREAEAREAEAREAETVAVQLSGAIADLRQRDSLRRRLAVTDRRLAEAEEAVIRTGQLVKPKGGTVAELGSLSLPRLLASLRGSRATELDRERAVRKRAEYSHAVAVAGRDAVATDRLAICQALADLAGVEERFSAALRARQAWLRARQGDDLARGLAMTAHRYGRLEALEVETLHALRLGREALESLSRARAALSSANSWASVDVFAGGALLADSVERNRMDDAGRLLHRAELALRRFVRELADPGPALESLDLNLTMTVLDTVFDNVFSDLPVRVSVCEPGEQECRAHRTVIRKVADLQTELILIRFERHTLDERREALLSAFPGEQCA